MNRKEELKKLKELKSMLSFCEKTTTNTIFDYKNMTNLDILISVYKSKLCREQYELNKFKDFLSLYLPNIGDITVSPEGKIIYIPKENQRYYNPITKRMRREPEITLSKSKLPKINVYHNEYSDEDVLKLYTKEREKIEKALIREVKSPYNKEYSIDVLNSFYDKVLLNRYLVSSEYSKSLGDDKVDFVYSFDNSKYNLYGSIRNNSDIDTTLFDLSKYILIPYIKLPVHIQNDVINMTEREKSKNNVLQLRRK